MIEAPHYSATGAKHKGAFALPGEYFDGAVHEAVLHQAIKTHLANQRQGTAKTKTRSYISGGNQKPWRQKGTGRARQGSIRSPLWRGGGTVFGPIPRDYRAELPRKVRQLARRSAFNARAREGAVHVLEALTFEAPKTSQLAGLLEKLGLEGQKVLVLSHGMNRNLYLSGRNIPSTTVMSYAEASAYDVLWSDAVVVEQAALGGGELVEGEGSAAAPAAAARKKAAKPAAKAATIKAKAKPAKKAPARPAAKRSEIKKPAPKKKKKE